MALLKNTIFITLLLLFSLELSRCQETAWISELAITETAISEDAPIEEVPITETAPSEWSEETITTRQEAPWSEGEIITTEETPIEEVTVEAEEEGQVVEEPLEEGSEGEEETTTRVEETTTEETITERSPGETENSEDPFEEDQPEEGGVVEEASLECRQETEEIKVYGYIMTFYPCCVSSKAECDNTYEPVCLNKVSVEDGQWKEEYETVNNICNACKGNSDLSWYSNGKCPWESGNNRPCQKNRRLRN